MADDADFHLWLRGHPFHSAHPTPIVACNSDSIWETPDGALRNSDSAEVHSLRLPPPVTRSVASLTYHYTVLLTPMGYIDVTQQGFSSEYSLWISPVGQYFTLLVL